MQIKTDDFRMALHFLEKYQA
jgi:hypothetical protein